MDMTKLVIHNIHKSFGNNRALDGVSFEVAESEIVAVLGPSGCGKSTLLNIIAGLELPDEGELNWDGKSLMGIPPHRRGFGLMFQDYMLFPHKNVFENVAFGLQMMGTKKDEIIQRVAEVLVLVGLPEYGSRDVSTLSGGEQQRVALARALAPSPGLLMLDEPLGSLDRTLRERLLFELGDILRQTHQTAIYVTHDQEEAFTLADRIVVMNQGQVAQIGSPQEVFRQPATEFVARFLGFNNLMDAEIRNEVVHTGIGAFPFDHGQNGQVKVLFRPDRVYLDNRGSHQIQGKVLNIVFRGSLCRIGVEIEGTVLTFEFPSAAPLPGEGKTIKLSFNPLQAIQILK